MATRQVRPIGGPASGQPNPSYSTTPVTAPQGPHSPFKGAPAPAPYNPGLADTNQASSIFGSLGSAIQWLFTPYTDKQLGLTSPGQGINEIDSAVNSVFSDASAIIQGPADFLAAFAWITNPLMWLRAVEFIAGIVLLVYGLHVTVSAQSGGARLRRWVTSPFRGGESTRSRAESTPTRYNRTPTQSRIGEPRSQRRKRHHQVQRQRIQKTTQRARKLKVS